MKRYKLFLLFCGLVLSSVWFFACGGKLKELTSNTDASPTPAATYQPVQSSVQSSESGVLELENFRKLITKYFDRSGDWKSNITASEVCVLSAHVVEGFHLFSKLTEGKDEYDSKLAQSLESELLERVKSQFRKDSLDYLKALNEQAYLKNSESRECESGVVLQNKFLVAEEIVNTIKNANLTPKDAGFDEKKLRLMLINGVKANIAKFRALKDEDEKAELAEIIQGEMSDYNFSDELVGLKPGELSLSTKEN